MPKIAYTTFGRNALLTGLISHVVAILVGMMSVSGTDVFFKIVYPFSWMLLLAGAYTELRHRGSRPLNTWRFYLIVFAFVFPILGPLIVIGLIYSSHESGRQPGNLSGLFPAMLKLRANALLLFLLFAVIHSKHDPYFKRHGMEDRHDEK